MKQVTGAIMQPHFCPWLGYIALYKHMDIFIYYDDVMNTNSPTWYSRNRIPNPKSPNNESYINAYITNERKRPINQVEVDLLKTSQNAINKIKDIYHRDSIERQFFIDMFYDIPYMCSRIGKGIGILSEVDKYIFESILKYLGIDNKDILLSSDIDYHSPNRVNNLLNLCSTTGIMEYCTGGASRDYMINEGGVNLLKINNIDTYIWSFDELEYHSVTGIPHKRFSIIDAIISIRKNGVLDLLNILNLEKLS